MDTLPLLRTHALFKGLPDKDLEAVARISVVRHFHNGQIIFQKGQDGASMMAVLAGQVKISTSSADGREILLNAIHPGGFFGEMAVIDGQPRCADATAMGETRLLVIARSAFMPLLERQTGMAVRLLELLCQKLRDTSTAVEDLALFPIPVRLARILLRLSTPSPTLPEVPRERALPMSQSELARLIGATRESVNKTLRIWAQRGLIDLDHGQVTIVKRGHLRVLAKLT